MNLFDGQKVTRVAFDYRVTIMVESLTEVAIGSPFTLEDDDGEVSLDPETIGRASGRVVDRVLHNTVRDGAIAEDGTFHLRLDNGVVVTVPPDPDYEAWQIAEERGQSIVCLPGGEVTTWGPNIG